MKLFLMWIIISLWFSSGMLLLGLLKTFPNKHNYIIKSPTKLIVLGGMFFILAFFLLILCILKECSKKEIASLILGYS